MRVKQPEPFDRERVFNREFEPKGVSVPKEPGA